MSTPPLEPDDPRLTAYALGEADETERRAVEEIMAESPEARSEVEQTRSLARSLTSEYAKEHELYLASWEENDLPSNVVAFRTGQRRSWQQATALILKIAAVAMVVASLTYLTLQRSRRSETATVASAPQDQSAVRSMAAPPAIGQFDKDQAAKARDEEGTDRMLASTSGQSSAVDPTPSPTAGPTADSLALAEEKPAADTLERASGGRAPGEIAKAEATPPTTRLDQNAAAPAAASSATSTTRRAAKTTPTEDRVARSVVRIRTATGKFLSGVIVSADGLILSPFPVPDGSDQQPCTVILADQREFPSVVKPASLGPAWSWLHIHATALPAVPLATDIPATDAALVTARIDPQTGNTTFARTASADASGDAALVFSPSGELLVPVIATQPEARVAQSRKVEPARSAPKKPFARPFTPEERAAIRQEANKKDGS